MKRIISYCLTVISFFAIVVLLFLSSGETATPANAQYDLDAGCFLAGTMVETPWGMVPIEDVRPGQIVRSFDPISGTVSTGVVTTKYSYTVSVYYSVELDTGTTLRVTREHPIYRGASYRSPNIDPVTKLAQWEGFEAVQYLESGDTVYTLTDAKILAPAKVVSLKKFPMPAVVYNMTVAGAPTYFADRIAVHNQVDKSSSVLTVPGATTAPTSIPSVGPAVYTGECVDTDLNNPPSCPTGTPVPCNVTCTTGGFSENACTPITNGPNAGESCGGNQFCPAPQGSCTYVASGITIGNNPCAGDAGIACWTQCCTPVTETPAPVPGETVTPSPTSTPEPVGGPQQNNDPPPTPAPVGSGCDSAVWGEWSACAGNPATTSRQNQCGPIQTAFCTGNIRARASVVTTSDTTCAAVRASTTYADGTIFFSTVTSAQQLPPQTQAGGAYVAWNAVLGGNYTLTDIPATDHTIQQACWSTNTGRSGEGLFALLSVPTEGETLTWDIGYTRGSAWAQAKEGNVYSSGILRSFVPSGTIPRSFILDGPGGLPGVAFYGTSYDFDSSLVGTGGSYVSSKNWLVNESYATINYYDLFYRRFGGMTTENTTDAVGGAIDKSAMTKPATGTYYLKGPVTTNSGGWVIGATEKTVIIIGESTPGAGDASLTIGGPITISAGGFVAFIVNGNITVASSVGGLYTLDTPTIEGVYVTSPTGTFATSLGAIGKERLVAQGMFVAGSFLLQRDLESVSGNITTAAELFLYNPQLLFSMPDSMRDVPITWEEVAP